MGRIILDGSNEKLREYMDIDGTDIIIKSNNKEDMEEWLELVRDDESEEIIQKLEQAISKLEKEQK